MDKPERELWRAVASSAGLVGQLGFTVAIPIVLGAVAGVHLDRWLNAHGLIVAPMLLLGMAAAGYGAFRMLRAVFRSK